MKVNPWPSEIKRKKWYESLTWRLLLVSLAIGSLLGITFQERILLSYGMWLADNLQEFQSSPADILVSMDVHCPRIEEAAQRVSRGEAKALYAFAYDDVDYHACKQNFLNAIEKYKIKDRAYWGGTSDTTMGAAQTFKSIVQQANIPHDTVLLTTVRFATRRSYWSLKRVLGDRVKINSYGTADDTQMNSPQWWKYRSSRIWVGIESQKLLGYVIYYGLLNQQDTRNIREKDLITPQ